jgi:hypothetical protein
LGNQKEFSTMTIAEKQILIDITNAIQNLAVAVDSLESVLIRKNLLQNGEIQANEYLHVQTVENRLAGLRTAIVSLGAL